VQNQTEKYKGWQLQRISKSLLLIIALRRKL